MPAQPKNCRLRRPGGGGWTTLHESARSPLLAAQPHVVDTPMSTITRYLPALAMAALAGVAAAMDSEQQFADKIDATAALHVHLFTTEGADLGDSKHSDTARAMANSAPHLLAVDVVESLRAGGFSAVSLDETEGGAPDGALQLVGRFTVLDPGSRNMRVWIGFGAGKSKVCVEGQLLDGSGKVLGDFADCRSGLGWGASGPQGDESAELLGDRIAAWLVKWAR